MYEEGARRLKDGDVDGIQRSSIESTTQAGW